MSLLSIDGHDKSPQHLPIGSLKMFGTNPAEDALWRVVWSESRYYMVGGNHQIYDESAGGYSDDKIIQQHGGKDPNLMRGQAGYRWLPLYPGQQSWILELWKSPDAFAGMSRDQWNMEYRDPQTGLLTLGPYPERGEYCHCFTFPVEPGASVVHATIYRIKAGWSHTYAEHQQANREYLEAKEKAKTENFRAFFRDKQQAFNNRPSNVNPGKRKKEDIKLKYTAEEVGLTTRPGFHAG